MMASVINAQCASITLVDPNTEKVIVGHVDVCDGKDHAVKDVSDDSDR